MSSKQQDAHGVAAFGARLNVKIAVFGRGPDGAVKVQFVCRPFAGPLAQTFQGHLDRARADLAGVVQIAELAFVPDLDRPLMARFVLTDAHALGVVAVGAERRGAGGADPFRAALVAFFLFLQAFLQGFHQLVETAQGFDLGFFVVAQVFFGQFGQPVFGQVQCFDHVGNLDVFQPPEGGGEGAVEAVQVGFVFYQRGAGQNVEAVDVIGHKAGVDGGQKRQEFAGRCRDAVSAEGFEEAKEHQPAEVFEQQGRKDAQIG